MYLWSAAGTQLATGTSRERDGERLANRGSGDARGDHRPAWSIGRATTRPVGHYAVDPSTLTNAVTNGPLSTFPPAEPTSMAPVCPPAPPTTTTGLTSLSPPGGPPHNEPDSFSRPELPNNMEEDPRVRKIADRRSRRRILGAEPGPQFQAQRGLDAGSPSATSTATVPRSWRRRSAGSTSTRISTSCWRGPTSMPSRSPRPHERITASSWPRCARASTSWWRSRSPTTRRAHRRWCARRPSGD